MIKFPIDPEYCLILNAFSHSGSLRAAAALLGIDPPSLVRKVRRLTEDTDYLHKANNRWILSEAGQRIAQWTEEIFNEQLLLKSDKARIRIGSFTWLAEEMLIPQFGLLAQSVGDKHSWSFHMVAKNLEHELIQSRVDFIVTGHSPNDPTIAHRKVAIHAWVAIAPKSWKKKFETIKDSEVTSILKGLPYIRHAEVNPEQYLDFKPEQIFNCAFDGVIGVRSAVASGYGWSIVPAMAIQSLLREKTILKFDIRCKLKDEISLWWLRNRKGLSSESKNISQWLENFKII